MRSEWRRLRTIARRLNRCVRHGDLLQCGPCDWEWTGTDAEWEELIPLTECVEPYIALMPTQGVCGGCGQTLWCTACHTEAAQQIQVPEGLMTHEEIERYHVLKDHMQRKDTRSK
jgi:hypothetical protein